MTFKMLNEAYFVILYQKELENSDIVGDTHYRHKTTFIVMNKLTLKITY